MCKASPSRNSEPSSEATKAGALSTQTLIVQVLQQKVCIQEPYSARGFGAVSVQGEGKAVL